MRSKPGLPEIASSLVAQQGPIGGEGHLLKTLQWIARRFPCCRDCLQQGEKPSTEQRLATGEPQGVNPQPAGNTNQAQLLFEAEQIRRILEIRTAVRTGQVAAGRQRQPKHSQRPRPLIDKR